MVRYRDNADVPVNLAGTLYYDVREISVNEWHRRENGEGRPEQVHVWIKLESTPHPMVMRFKGPRGLDQFIAALIEHRRNVFDAIHGPRVE